MANKPNSFLTSAPRNPRFESGKKTRTVEYNGVFTAANSAANDLCILAGPLRFGDRISAIRANSAGTPALTGATSNDLGFWKRNPDGSFVQIQTGSTTLLWSGVTLAAALTHPNLLTALNTSLDHSRNIGQLLNLGDDQEPASGVYLILRTNAANTATGPLNLALAIDIDEATTR